MSGHRRQRGVAMVEFALVAGLFFLLVMALLDVGKGVYVKNTLDAAARDGARAGVVLNSPTLSTIETSIKQHSSDVAFATPCPFSPPPATAASLPNNKGAIYINNMPEGGKGSVDLSGCTALGIAIPSPVSGRQPLTVTVVYKYTPITPLVAQFTGSLTFVSTSTMTTEY